MQNLCRTEQSVNTINHKESLTVDNEEHRSTELFEMTEIKIEEVSIDGICGVY